MRYQNAKQLLPEPLLKELQRYAAGEILYVPAPVKKKRGGGETYRRELAERNRRIHREWQEGASMKTLAGKYYLSEKSIQRIIRQETNRKG